MEWRSTPATRPSECAGTRRPATVAAAGLEALREAPGAKLGTGEAGEDHPSQERVADPARDLGPAKSSRRAGPGPDERSQPGPAAEPAGASAGGRAEPTEAGLPGSLSRGPATPVVPVPSAPRPGPASSPRNRLRSGMSPVIPFAFQPSRVTATDERTHRGRPPYGLGDGRRASGSPRRTRFGRRGRIFRGLIRSRPGLAPRYRETGKTTKGADSGVRRPEFTNPCDAAVVSPRRGGREC